MGNAPIGGKAVSDQQRQVDGKKPPPKRMAVAKADPEATPEPR